jgi:hemoglobin
MNLLLETADELQLPSDPEFRSAIVAYLEWGSRLAVIDSALPAEMRGPEWPATLVQARYTALARSLLAELESARS